MYFVHSFQSENYNFQKGTVFQLGWGPLVPDVHQIDLGIDARNYTIKDLDTSREYVVSLRAVHNQGPGLPIYETAVTSSGSLVDTFADSIPSASLKTPVEVRAETLSSSGILVSWTDLDNPSPETRVYSVKCTSKLVRLHLFNWLF